jgi:bifunctional non-homologous end joining protein LigD
MGAVEMPARLAALPPARLAPGDLPLMLPVLVQDLPPGSGWLFELKWDGVRVLALRREGRVELWSRNQLPVGRRYPEIVAALAALPGGDLALDGEVVALDDAGRPSFERLQSRMHRSRGVPRAAAEAPVTAYLYDCLAIFGRDVRGLGLRERKTLLRALLGASDALRFADHVEDDGPRFLSAVAVAGLEGVVAKRVDAPYRGGRHHDWRKIKCARRQEFVIGGWTDPQGTRTHLGAIHVGFYENGDLIYAGRAGSGLDDATLAELHVRLDALAIATCPFIRGPAPQGREHHWVRPALVCEVRFTEWTTEGLLRHPVYLGLRPDRLPTEVRREDP